MIQPFLIGASLILSVLGFAWNKPVNIAKYDAGANNIILGATNFPTSLDSLTNPSATDSVATVSHSAQHANANDAIEALEAKLGIGASTAISNSALVGTGSGSSGWSATPTLTGLTTTTSTSTNLLVTSSTTLQSFTFTTATGTSATTTNLFTTTASTTNFFGGGLSTCTGSNAVQYSAGRFSCGSVAATGVTVFSTTTARNLATTTLRTSDGSLPSGNSINISMVVPLTVGNGATTTADVIMAFNGDTSSIYSFSRISAASHANTTNNPWIILSQDSADGRFQRYFNIDIANFSGMMKAGSYDSYVFGTTTTHTVNGNIDGEFIWANTDQITQVDIWWDTTQVQFATSTKINVLSY